VTAGHGPVCAAVAALVVLGVSAPTATSVGAIVVEKAGFGQESAAVGSLYSFGVVLRNSSATRDAVGVTVSVNVFAKKGPGVIYGRDFAITYIPAGSRFVVGDGGSGLGLRIARVTATVRVRAMERKRRRLPPVSALRIDRTNGGVTATVANPYPRQLQLFDASAYAVVLDGAGRVVGGGSVDPLAAAVAGPATLAPGAYLRVAIPVSGGQLGIARRAEVSINP
jgi:hypothetical protein